VARWIAPEWNGAWDHHGLFREHPVGILIPSAVLIRAGVPEGQAAYVANMFYQAAVLALVPLVAGVLMSGVEARSLAWILQLLPVAFVYRIRGNQEHPLLMCFLAMLYGTHRARREPGWLLLVVASFCALVLIKGAFAMFALVAAALWLVVVPPPRDREGGSDWWAWGGVAASVVAAAIMMMGYESVYVRTTGESFLEFYRSTRLGQSMELSDPRVVPHAIVNVGWYLARVAWFAAPWSLAAFAVVVILTRATLRRQAGEIVDERSGRGIWWAVAVTIVFIAVLSPANVRAERFIFPTYFMMAAIGAVAAMRQFEWFGRFVAQCDPRWWLPAGVWLVTFLLSLGSRLGVSP
jgi:hypothetical protein